MLCIIMSTTNTAMETMQNEIRETIVVHGKRMQKNVLRNFIKEDGSFFSCMHNSSGSAEHEMSRFQLYDTTVTMTPEVTPQVVVPLSMKARGCGFQSHRRS